ncbi:MAG TPA: ABC transporter substrate-binding protein, partial [Acidimicrobiales bacterium]|nr:ABC transporter substrate-binding protein [Acidimicrobiales bacterium]
LASSVTHHDGAYSITLRRGVVDCAGDELTAADVVFALRRAAQTAGAPGSASWSAWHAAGMLGPVVAGRPGAPAGGSIRVTGPFSLVMRPDPDDGLLPEMLSQPATAPVDAALVQRRGGKDDPFGFGFLATHDGGFGPYCLSSYEPGSEVVLRPNPHWVLAPRPALGLVVVRAVTSPGRRLAEVESGAAEVAEGLGTAQYAALAGATGADGAPVASAGGTSSLPAAQTVPGESSTGPSTTGPTSAGLSTTGPSTAGPTSAGASSTGAAVVLSDAATTGHLQLDLNFGDAPWGPNGSPRATLMRQAVAAAIPYRQILAVLDGAASPWEGDIPPEVPGALTSPVALSTDPARAEVDLADAGHGSGRGLPASGLVLTYPTGQPLLATVATLVEGGLAAVGIKLRLDPQPELAFQAHLGQDAMALVTGGTTFPDAAWYTQRWYAAPAAGGALDSDGYDDPDLNALVARAEGASGAARALLAREEQDLELTDLPAVPLAILVARVVVASDVASMSVAGPGAFYAVTSLRDRR